MGSIKKQKRKFERPAHLWEADRLEEERGLMRDYGLKNKKELWKFRSLLRGFRQQAKLLTAMESEQAERQKKLLVDKLIRLGLVDKSAKSEDVLGLDLIQLLDRRLQTQVLRLNLAKTANQARQFIVHGHILVNDQKVSVPSYLVKSNDKISFLGTSSLAKEDHPEREAHTLKEKRTKIIKKEEVKTKEGPKVEAKKSVEAPKVEEAKNEKQ